VGEFGMNLMVYEFGEDAVLVDCGMMFPESATLGIDVIIPDMSYIFAAPSKFKALFLTHCHEDHIGAVPFLLERVPIPVFALPMTLGLIEDKLDEFDLEGDLRAITPGEVITIGALRVEAFHVTHSTVDSVGFAITCPLGTVVHSGDFKLDPTPVDGRQTDLERLKEIGDEGVLLLLSDSTNVLVEGHCPSERSVGPTIGNIVDRAPGRVIVTTFSSHIYRMQQVIDVARAAGRDVEFVGRSMIRNADVAERLGYIRRGHVASGRNHGVLLVTGSQGEPRSALARAAVGQNRRLELGPTDTVVISARIIPGNELPIQRLIDNVCRRGATVFAHEVPLIHASGHGYTDELKTLVQLLRPRYFVPAHGTLHMLVKHADLAVAAGLARENVRVVTNGFAVELDGRSIQVSPEPVAHGKVFIDSESEEVPLFVVRDRRHLSEDGFVIVVAVIDSDGRLMRRPEIITRGVLHVDAKQHVLDQLRQEVASLIKEGTLDERLDRDLLQDHIRSTLKRFFRKRFGRRPLILPVVWEM
jgi:ribonuclease J